MTDAELQAIRKRCDTAGDDYEGTIARNDLVRQDVPNLLAEVERLTKDLENCRGIARGEPVQDSEAGDWSETYIVVAALRMNYEAALQQPSEYEQLFDLQYRRTNEGNRDTLPDLGVLLKWLMEQIAARDEKTE